MNCLRNGSMVGMCVITCLCVLLTSASNADEYASGFESLNSSTTGTSLTGQDSYYIPVVTSVDYNVYDYQNNTLGIAQNPNGGNRFVAGEGPGDGTNFARAQRDLSFSTGIVDVVYDLAAFFTGTAPSANNLGSFSTRTGVNRDTGYIHLFRWVDATAATNFEAVFNAFNADGSAQAGITLGAAFTDLELNHWYQFETRLDYNTNQITRAVINDLTTGARSSEDLTDVFLPGGTNGVIDATGFRFFSGAGAVAGNGLAWDNISIAAPIPEPASFAVLLLGGVGLIISRKRRHG